MKILILSSRMPFPIEKGDKLRLYHQMKGLAKENQLFIISLDEENIDSTSLKHIESLCEQVKVFKTNKWKSKLNAALGVFNEKPFHVNYFFRKKIKKEIDALVNEIKPDVIYCQLIRMAEYTRGLNFPKVLDLMDAFSLGALRRSKHEKGIIKLFFHIEAKRLAKYEVRMPELFDSMSIISNQDKQYLVLNNGLNSDRISIITNGLDTEFFIANRKDQKIDVLFVGNMGYHPNILAAKYLIKKIAPLVNSEYNFQIAGTRPIASIKSLATKNVEVTGWIDDIRDAYNGARIFVAPIFSGAGQQNKILEAMAMGLPCVTTTIVNEGIGAVDGKEIFIADDEEAFANKIELLLNDEELRKQVAISSRKFIEENYSWKSENDNLLKIINSVIKEEQ